MAGVQLGGLVSGMDTSTIIQQQMEIDSQKLQTKQTQVDELKEEKSMWSDIEIKLLELKYAAKDLSRSSTFMTKETSSSDSSAATATAKAGTSDATYTLTNVTVATAGKKVGDTLDVSNGVKAKIEGNDTWDDTLTYNGTATAVKNRKFSEYSDLGLTTGTVTINGASIEIEATDTLSLVATKINSSNAGIKATVTDEGILTFEGENTGDTITLSEGDTNFFTKFGINGGTYTEPKSSDMLRTIQDIKNDASSTSDFKGIEAGYFTVNGFTFEVKESDTVSSIIKNINSSEAGVNAVYDSKNKRFTFVAKTAGEDVVLENDTSNFLHSIGVMAVGEETATYEGTGSSYTLNGIAMTGDTNEIEIDGTTINLKSNIAADETVTITVSNSSDKAVEKIKDFIDKYNTVVDLIEENSKAEVEDNTDENMSDSSSYKNSTVSKGILNGDSSATQIVNSLRRALTEMVINVDTGYNQLAAIGITAQDNESSHLTLDEDALQTALDDNPEEVYKLFANSGKEKTKTIAYTTGSAATLTSGNDVNFGTSYSGTAGVSVESRTFSDYSSGISSGTIKINGVSIYVSSSDSMSSVITKINSSTAGVTASFSSGKFTLTGNDVNKTITLEAGTSNFLYRTGMLQETSKYDGIAARVDNYVTPMTKYQGTIDSKKDYYENQIDDMEDWMANYAKRMEDKQNRYIKQFAAMEQAMSTANNQSAWLSSQLSSL